MERTYRNVRVDLDDLADALIEWFARDGFEVQDFLEGPTIYLQAKKESLVTRATFSTLAVNVRLTPLTRGFKLEVAPGEWLDKLSGAGLAGLAFRFINPILGLGTGAATGWGIYQQIKLPDRIVDFVEFYLDDNATLEEEDERRPRDRAQRDQDRAQRDQERAQDRAKRDEERAQDRAQRGRSGAASTPDRAFSSRPLEAPRPSADDDFDAAPPQPARAGRQSVRREVELPDDEEPPRRGGRGRRSQFVSDQDLDAQIAALDRETRRPLPTGEPAPAPATASAAAAPVPAAKHCPQCGAKLYPGAAFCSQCGARVKPAEDAPAS